MPIYEYECHDCRRRVSLLVLRPSTAPAATCPRCHGPNLSRLMSRFATVRSEDGRLDMRRVTDGEGSLVAVLPLYEEAPGVFQMLGGAEVSDYLDLLAVAGREEEAWTALLESRAAEPVEWRLHAVPASSPTLAVLPPLARACGLAAEAVVEERCPVLTLPGTWDEYLAGLGGKHRHEPR